MTKNHIKQHLFWFILWCIVGCISQSQLTLPDIQKDLQKETQHHINKKNEPCNLTENKPRPAWIDQLPNSKRQLFGIGVAPKQSPVSRQLQAAKILAMRDISQQINVHVKSLYQERIKSNEAPEIQSHTELTAEALLQGVKIIDQWNDMSTCEIYMLVVVDIDSDKESHDPTMDSLKQTKRLKRVDLKPTGIVSSIQSEGTCIIQGISPRQAQTIAIQRARALAIDKASGIEIHASKIVSDSMLVLDFIRSYSKGYIVREKVNWHPVRQYQKNSESPPLLEYHVSIVADVYIPQKKPDTIGLEASLNKSIYNKGECAVLRIKTHQTCQIAIFNIQANDRIATLFPNFLFPNNTVNSNESFEMNNLYPEPLPEEQSNYEALFICASLDDAINFQNLFSVDEQMKFSDFFKRYSTISDKCTDVLIPYQVVSGIE
jgi:hypothetical protein